MEIYDIIKHDLLCVAYRNQYDLTANNIVKAIFHKIKNGETNFNIENVQINIIEKDDLNTFENFKIDAYVAGNNHGLISLDIYINKNFSEKDYSRFYYDLYDATRHELEHINNLELGKKPNSEYFDIVKQIKSKPELEKRVNLVSRYMLSDTEVDAYIRSMMYVAKKQNKHVFEVIEQVIKRAFFYNNPELMKIALDNPEIKIIIDNVRGVFRDKLKDYYPNIKEKWL